MSSAVRVADATAASSEAPGARWLPFLADWFPAGQGFAAGEAPENFRILPLGANVMVNICFEDNFADLVRAQVRPDTDFVLNLTNNGWFGESAAQWQHAANAVFRAVDFTAHMLGQSRLYAFSGAQCLPD